MVPRMLESSRNVQKHVEVCEVMRRVGNQVTEFGFEYFCLDYVSKIGVSVTECNTSLVTSRVSVLNCPRGCMQQLYALRARTRKKKLLMQLLTWNCRRRKFPLQMQSEEDPHSTSMMALVK